MGWAFRSAPTRTLARLACTALSASAALVIGVGASHADTQLASLAPSSAIAETAARPAAAPAVTWPTKGWPTSAPEVQGIDSKVLAQALEQIRERRIPIHSLLIERHGTIVLDTYFYPFANNRQHNVYSVTKSVTSMLVGIAMADHRLSDLNAPVLSLLPLRTDDPRKSRITLAEMLSMTSGLDCRPAAGLSLLQQMLKSRHLAAFMMNQPEDAEPGTVFDYCGGNTEVVSAVLTRATGTSALDFARARLFSPLGINNVSWPTDGDRVSHGWGDLELQPRDMAKLGYLWLHNGRWEDRQVIPADYLAQALSRHINVQPGIDYGYGMWLYPGHTPVDFEANGSYGQRITVIPSLDTVEVMTGGGFDANIVSAMIAPAIRSESTLPADLASDTRLAELNEEASLPAGKRGTLEILASIPEPKPKPIAPAASLLAQAPPSSGYLHLAVYPRPKPEAAAQLVAESLPIPRPKPVAPHPAVIALSDIPLPRPKPQLAPQFEAAVAGVAVAPVAGGMHPQR